MRTISNGQTDVPVIEDIVHVFLSCGSCDDRGPRAPGAVSERRLLAVESVGEVVVEPVVREALVDGESDVVESGDLHDDLATVVVDGVEGRVADDLVHADHWLVRDIRTGYIVAV